MKEIELTRGKVALVDDADYDWLMQYKWYAKVYRNRHWYAARSVYAVHSRIAKTIFMHNIILGSLLVDHKNRDGLNNQRHNLRKATHSQNCYNRIAINKTGFRGVVKTRSHKYTSQIRHKNVSISLGTYLTPEDAAIAYDIKAIELYGEFAILNFPDRYAA